MTIRPTYKYVHLGTNADEALTFVQRPKPLTFRDKLEPHACSCRCVPKPCPSGANTCGHVASCCPTPASANPTNGVTILATDNASIATNTSTHQNPPNRYHVSISWSLEVHRTTSQKNAPLPNGGVQRITVPSLCFDPIWDPIDGFNGWLSECPTMANWPTPRWDATRVSTSQGGESGQSYLKLISIQPEHLRRTNLNQLLPLIVGSLWR